MHRRMHLMRRVPVIVLSMRTLFRRRQRMGKKTNAPPAAVVCRHRQTLTQPATPIQAWGRSRPWPDRRDRARDRRCCAVTCARLAPGRDSGSLVAQEVQTHGRHPRFGRAQRQGIHAPRGYLLSHSRVQPVGRSPFGLKTGQKAAATFRPLACLLSRLTRRDACRDASSNRARSCGQRCLEQRCKCEEGFDAMMCMQKPSTVRDARPCGEEKSGDNERSTNDRLTNIFRCEHQDEHGHVGTRAQ